MTLPPLPLDDDHLPPLDSPPAFSLDSTATTPPPHPPLPLPDQLSPQDSPPIQAPSLSPLLLSTPRPSSTAPLSPPSARGGWPSQDARSSPPPSAAGEEDEEGGAEEDTPRPSLMHEPTDDEEEGEAGVRTFVSMDRLLLASYDDGETFEAEKREKRGPPTPLGLPGGWMLGGRRERGKGKKRAEEEEEDAALLLPPPFLTDDSARESFDGLLNSRPSTHRRLARLRLEQERLHSLGRAPPAPFPQRVWKGVGKVVRLLGPPGGFEGRKDGRGRVAEGGEGADEERGEEQGRRRRVKRAESGVKAFEVGMKVGRKVAGRLERHRSWRGGVGGAVDEPAQKRVEGREAGKGEKEGGRERRMRAATPSDLLGSPPHHAFTSSSPPSSYPSTPPFLPPPPLTNPSSPTLTPLDALPLPALEPLFPHAAAPLPTVQTPFTLDPMEELDEGYFGLRRRGSRKRRKESLDADDASAALSSSSPSKSTFSLPHAPPSASSSSTATTTTWPSHLLDLLIYLLIGSPSPPPPPSHLTLHALDTSYSSLGGLLGLLIHLIGFAFFLLYHLSALLVSSYFAAKTAGVWVYWAGRNLSGRTEVSRSVREYWRTCKGEWGRVCEEEGERKLGVVGVVRALLELAALQSMTRHRFLSPGPGNLKLLNGPFSSLSSPSPTSPRLPPSATPRFGPSLLRRRTSQHLPRLDPRPAFTQRASSYRWTSGGDEQDGEGLVVEKQGGGVLEGSLISHDWEEREGLMGGKGRKASRVVTPKVAPLSLGQAVEAGEAADDDDPPPFNLDGSSPHSPTSPPLLPLPELPTTPLLSLLTTLKRHCRLATASYGLHVYLVDAPTPLLTPSGKTLPHRVFAHLGGMSDHRNVLHVALQKRYDEDGGGGGGGDGEREAARAIGGKGERTKEEKEAMPYAPTFYLLRDDANGEIVCVIRGTQSLADVRTDLDGDFVDLPLPPPHPPCAASSPSSSPPTYRIHSSILSTAQHLLSPPSISSSAARSPLFDKLRQILHDHPRYSLTFTGHSLGAALASTLAVLLGAYDEERGEWYVDPESKLVKLASGNEVKAEGQEEEKAFRRPLRAVCFAHPTTVCANLAARCALPFVPPSPSPPAEEGGATEKVEEEEEDKGTPLVINVSLGADVICRMGIPHVRELRRAIGRLDRMRSVRRKEEGEEGILSGWWRWRKVAARIAEREGEEGEEARREKEELEEKAWRLRREVERWDAPEVVEGDGGETAIPAGKCYHLDRLPPDLEARRRKELREEGGGVGAAGGAEEDDEPLFGLWEVRDSSRFYRMPQLEGDLVAAHMPKAYLDAVDALTL